MQKVPSKAQTQNLRQSFRFCGELQNRSCRAALFSMLTGAVKEQWHDDEGLTASSVSGNTNNHHFCCNYLHCLTHSLLHISGHIHASIFQTELIPSGVKALLEPIQLSGLVVGRMCALRLERHESGIGATAAHLSEDYVLRTCTASNQTNLYLYIHALHPSSVHLLLYARVHRLLL